jgi:type I restriction enzyme S subunit
VTANWQTLAFDDAVEEASGGNTKTPLSAYFSSGVLPIVDQGEGLIGGYSDDLSAACRAPLPLVIFGDHTRRLKFIDFPFGMGADGVKVLIPKPGIDAKYLYHFLRALELPAAGYDRHFKYLKRTKVAVPPLSEQRRITEILDRAETLRAQRRQALAQLDALGEAIFLEMFGDPVRNDKQWPKVELGELGDVQGGLQLSAGRSSLPETVPYLRVANVHRNRLELGEIKTFKATLPEFERTKLQVGDVLIVEGHGNAEEIGRCALWDGSIPNCSHQNHLIRLRPNTAKAIPPFVASFLNSPGGRQGLLRASNTTSGLNTISVSKVRTCPALLPPLALQLAFAARLERLAQVKCVGEQSVAELKALFASLQHRAFRGEL